MKDSTYKKFQEAKNKHDLIKLKELYINNKKEHIIAFEYAKLLLEKKKNEEAVKETKEILISLLKTTNWAYAAHQLGKLELDIGNINQARYYFEILKIKGKTKDKNYAILELAKLEYNIGNIETARKNYLYLINNGNSNDKNCAILELAKLEFYQGNNNEAKNLLLVLLNTTNKNFAILELGKMEFELGNIEEAKKIFLSLLNTSNKNYATLQLGKIEFILGNFKTAREYFTILLNTSSWTHAIMELGKLEFYDGNIEKSIAYFETLTNNKSDISGNLYAILNLIKINIKQKNYTEAVNYLNYLNSKKLILDLRSQVEIIKLYLTKELNIFFKNGIEINANYNNEQFLDYDKNKAINHITHKHKKEFSSTINISNLFEEIKDKLTEEYKIYHLDINDIYDIPYQNIGNNYHILRVVTQPNTKNILTMYPLGANNIYSFDEPNNSNSLTLKKIKQQ